MWTLIRKSDSRRAAKSASAYLPDARVQHFWDLWKYSAEVYKEQLKFPKDKLAWDIFVVYKPNLQWAKTPPPPTAWMQNLHIDHGPRYTPELLQEQLEKWIR